MLNFILYALLDFLQKNGLKQKMEVQLVYLVGELPKYYWASKNAR